MIEPIPETRLRYRELVIGIGLLAAFVLVLANWSHPVVRLEPAWINPPALLTAFTLPWLATVSLMKAVRTAWDRVLMVCVLLPFTLYTLTCGPFIGMEAVDSLRDRSNPGFEFVRSEAVFPGRISLYRTNGGATTSFGIAVRHELRIVPGVVLVRELEGFYPAFDGTVAVLSPNRVRVTVPGYEGQRPDPETREYRLRRFVYF
ncbi:MAG: hypothetical protein QOK37_3221 [Thermoanaerobaculia bacterium]|nr:hypothetical protein [Thermoanaerobaculia bacterium]